MKDWVFLEEEVGEANVEEEQDCQPYMMGQVLMKIVNLGSGDLMRVMESAEG